MPQSVFGGLITHHPVGASIGLLHVQKIKVEMDNSKSEEQLLPSKEHSPLFSWLGTALHGTFQHSTQVTIIHV